MNISVQSWNDFSTAQPLDIRSLVLGVSLGVGNTASFSRSTTFLQSSWGTNSIALNNVGLLGSLDTSDAMSGIEANQWTLSHQMVNVGSGLAPAMRKVMFLRAGKQWVNTFQIGFGANTYVDVQLAFRDNLGTTGAYLGAATPTVPVFAISGNHTGNESFVVTVLQPGNYSMVLLVKDNVSLVYSTLEMEWIVL